MGLEVNIKGTVPVLNQLSTAMKTWGSGGIAPPFLTSGLGGGEWSTSRPGRFTPGEAPPVPIGPQSLSGCCGEEKNLAPPG
jgi:hypothetical protein